MIVWRAIHNDEAGGTGASYHSTKVDANKAAKTHGGGDVEKVAIDGREQAASALNEAIRYGGA